MTHYISVIQLLSVFYFFFFINFETFGVYSEYLTSREMVI